MPAPSAKASWNNVQSALTLPRAILASSKRIRRLALAANLALIGAPIYFWQGWRVRRNTPRLPEAPGERAGVITGRSPSIRIIGIGESPLAGTGLDHQDETLTARLAGELAEATGSAVHWTTAARGGATAADTLNELLPALPAKPADLVVVGLGVNDSLRLRSARHWKNDLASLLDALDQRVGPAVVILTGIPPMQYFPVLPKPLATMLGLRARLLDAVSARLASQRHNLVHAPMNLDPGSTELFCRDGFHPNAHGHRLWAEQLALLGASEQLYAERVSAGKAADRVVRPE